MEVGVLMASLIGLKFASIIGFGIWQVREASKKD